MAAATPSTANKARKQSGATRIVLLVLLAVLLLGLGYDYLVARRGRDSALQKVQAEFDQLEAEPDADIATLPVAPSPEQLRQLLGIQPDHQQEVTPFQLVETYTWEGIFWRYDLLIEYTGRGRGRGLHSVEAQNRFRFAP